jgi:hypothetical protein
LVVQPPEVDKGIQKPVQTSPPMQQTAAYITLGAGGVMLVASGVLLLVRHSQISELNTSCPGGHCPASREEELSSTRKRALVEGPLSATLGILGLAAAGAGVTLLLTLPEGSTNNRAFLAPTVTRAGAGLTLGTTLQ